MLVPSADRIRAVLEPFAEVNGLSLDHVRSEVRLLIKESENFAIMFYSKAVVIYIVKVQVNKVKHHFKEKEDSIMTGG